MNYNCVISRLTCLSMDVKNRSAILALKAICEVCLRRGFTTAVGHVVADPTREGAWTFVDRSKRMGRDDAALIHEGAWGRQTPRGQLAGPRRLDGSMRSTAGRPPVRLRCRQGHRLSMSYADLVRDIDEAMKSGRKDVRVLEQSQRVSSGKDAG